MLQTPPLLLLQKSANSVENDPDIQVDWPLKTIPASLLGEVLAQLDEEYQDVLDTRDLIQSDITQAQNNFIDQKSSEADAIADAQAQAQDQAISVLLGVAENAASAHAAFDASLEAEYNALLNEIAGL